MDSATVILATQCCGGFRRRCAAVACAGRRRLAVLPRGALAAGARPRAVHVHAAAVRHHTDGCAVVAGSLHSDQAASTLGTLVPGLARQLARLPVPRLCNSVCAVMLMVPPVSQEDFRSRLSAVLRSRPLGAAAFASVRPTQQLSGPVCCACRGRAAPTVCSKASGSLCVRAVSFFRIE